LGDGAKNLFGILLDAVGARCGERTLPTSDRVSRVLLVRVNFRLGNTVLVTSLLPVLRARFPQAAIDILTADNTVRLLDGLGLQHVHCVSRRFIRAPWRIARLLRHVRRQRYDVAVDGGMTSFSGSLYAWLSGARWRVGGQGRNDRLLNVRLALPPSTSVYEAAQEFARALDVCAVAWPRICITNSETRRASAALSQWRNESGLEISHFIGVFVGGHARKRWPLSHWLALLEALDARKVPVLVFVGPEERAMVGGIAGRSWTSVRVNPPGPLREFAALLSCASLLITPDSGPMHLAAALSIPVLALLRSERSTFYVPPGEVNASCLNASAADVSEIACAVISARTKVDERPATKRPASDLATVTDSTVVGAPFDVTTGDISCGHNVMLAPAGGAVNAPADNPADCTAAASSRGGASRASSVS
jgi:heptosyltransferase-3